MLNRPLWLYDGDPPDIAEVRAALPGIESAMVDRLPDLVKKQLQARTYEYTVVSTRAHEGGQGRHNCAAHLRTMTVQTGLALTLPTTVLPPPNASLKLIAWM